MTPDDDNYGDYYWQTCHVVQESQKCLELQHQGWRIKGLVCKDDQGLRWFAKSIVEDSPLLNFILTNEGFEHNPNCSMTEEEFLKSYNEYRKIMNLKKIKWNREHYMIVFGKVGLQMVQDMQRNGLRKRTIHGLKLVRRSRTPDDHHGL